MNIKKIINESIDVFLESKIRALDYSYELQYISSDAFRKFSQNNVCNLKYRLSNENCIIQICSRDQFNLEYPDRKGSGGFMDYVNKIIVICYEGYSPRVLYQQLLHEVEHLLDHTNERSGKITNPTQIMTQNKTYNYIYNPSLNGSGEKSQINQSITNIIYTLWINTEKNAYASIIVSGLDYINEIFDELQDDIDYLKYVPIEGNREIWERVLFTVAGMKNKMNLGNNALNTVKKHFLSQSYHKLKQWKRTVIRKYENYKMTQDDSILDLY